MYVSSIDLSGALPPGAPTRISQSGIGEHVGPSWSPDGRTIAYFTRRPEPHGHVPLKTLTIKEVASGRERDLTPRLSYLGGYSPQWSPDSQSVVVWAKDRDRDDRWGYFRVDIRTSETTPVVVIGNNGFPAISQCALDGRTFLYVDPARGIVSHNFTTHEDKTVVSRGERSNIWFFAISPDGQIAFVSNDKTTLEVQTPDGTTHVLATASSQPRDCASNHGRRMAETCSTRNLAKAQFRGYSGSRPAVEHRWLCD